MSDVPIRQKSAYVPKDDFQFARHCERCGASFLLLAPGKTGERGVWRDWKWFCSIECDES